MPKEIVGIVLPNPGHLRTDKIPSKNMSSNVDRRFVGPLHLMNGVKRGVVIQITMISHNTPLVLLLLRITQARSVVLTRQNPRDPPKTQTAVEIGLKLRDLPFPGPMTSAMPPRCTDRTKAAGEKAGMRTRVALVVSIKPRRRTTHTLETCIVLERMMNLRRSPTLSIRTLHSPGQASNPTNHPCFRTVIRSLK